MPVSGAPVANGEGTDSVASADPGSSGDALGAGVSRSSGEDEAESRPTFAIIARRFAFVAVLIALDLWSKAYVFRWLGEISGELVRDDCGHMRYHILGEDVGWLTFMRIENPGAAFGKFANSPHILIGLRVVAVIGLTYMIARAKKGSPWFTAALLLVLAGALGNLYDNLFLEATGGHPYGKVRDFIDVYFANWEWHFPTFNVADSCITVGAFLLLLGSLAKDKDAEEEDGAGDASNQPA